jgi:hypothetical protein
MFKNPLTQKITDFLTEIGLEVIPNEFDGATFLPGILIRDGKILVDEAKLAFSGDLLHEAGHLAVAPANVRNRLSDEVELPDFNMDLIESGAIIWSYAAALHLEIDPRIVFHENGYRGNSESLLFNFSLGVYIGVNILEEAKMTVTGERATESHAAPFPKMLKWLRD